jgi:isopenicillin N synthase-like dioxygenase
MIPRLDAQKLAQGDAPSLDALREAATDVGFATVHNTGLSAARVAEVIAAYGAFFRLSEARKRALDMARTGSNRGWGAPGSEQVDPAANPDYKQFFDVGFQLPEGHPLSGSPFYAPNLWPEDADFGPDFRRLISAYYDDALGVSKAILRGLWRWMKPTLRGRSRPRWPCCAPTFTPPARVGPVQRISALRPTPIMAV